MAALKNREVRILIREHEGDQFVEDILVMLLSMMEEDDFDD